MKKIFLFVSLIFSISTFGQTKKAEITNVADCSPPTSFAELNINQVRARINQGGDMFWNWTSRPTYEVPKNSGRNSISYSSIWLGGVDNANQLKVSGVRYKQSGEGFWPGPFNLNTGLPQSEICSYYDKLFKIDKTQVQTFIKWFENGKQDQLNGTNNQAKLFPNYQIPEIILEWPAQGRNYAPYFEDEYLAPFFDANNDGVYNPLDGDYPKFAFDGMEDCNTHGVNYLYGDQTIWRVFNDKGNINTEFGSITPGLEYRVQSYGYNTANEIAYFTFHNYQIINRSTYTLNNFYIGGFVNCGLGNPYDDYVGCDVERGIGFAYNGDDNDESYGGAIGYDQNPPAIGVDFFQGPFQDHDQKDNRISADPYEWDNNNANPYTLNTIGFEDGIVDNERVGLTNFLYFGSGGTVRSTPRTGPECYYFLQSKWRDGTQMVYGGTGYIGDASADKNTPTRHMYPDSSDMANWSSFGKKPNGPWSEVTSGNTPGSRRFCYSSGPITLLPGAINSFTLGYPWAQASSGVALASLQKMKEADDIAQKMFDNCFMPMEMPDAPVLQIKEYDKKLVLLIDNPAFSNNYQECYAQQNPYLVPPENFNLNEQEKIEFSQYNFQGYKVYQVIDTSVNIAQLEDSSKAIQIFQCDIRDEINQIFNLEANSKGEIQLVEKVIGKNEGIQKSIELSRDYFTGKNLTNHKSYYYLAVAYAFNPNGEMQYVQSIQLPDGSKKPFTGIPHKTSQKNNGTLAFADFGMQPQITKLEGVGNNGKVFALADSTIDESLLPPYKPSKLKYAIGKAPIDVKVIDPLNVKAGNYYIQVFEQNENLDSTGFKVYGDEIEDTLVFKTPLKYGIEQLIPEIGISIQIINQSNPGISTSINNGYVGAEIEFEDENEWLSGVQDIEGFDYQNWTLSGRSAYENDPSSGIKESDFDDWDWYFDNGIDVRKNLDGNENFENILEGTWAPFRLAADHSFGPIPTYYYNKRVNQRSQFFTTADANVNINLNQLLFLHSTQIVITPDKSKWSRVPVIEMGDTLTQDDVQRGRLRSSKSLDKNGNATPVDTISENPENANYISEYGMSWFPGYAIDLETGERLNMAFGESSYLVNENGRDMIWNPTSTLKEGLFDDIRFGGLHYIMVFRNNVVEEDFYSITKTFNNPQNRFPAYDEGRYMVEQLKQNTIASLTNVYRAGMWVGLPLLADSFELKPMADGLVPSEVKIRINVANAIERYSFGESLNFDENLEVGEEYLVLAGPIKHDTTNYVRGNVFKAIKNTIETLDLDSYNLVAKVVNKGLPLYQFSLNKLAPIANNQLASYNALDQIMVVPNPYYAYSLGSRLEGYPEVKITNIPMGTVVSIYTVNGELLKTLKADTDVPHLIWNTTNLQNNYVAPGIYLMHVQLPNGREKILKWVKASE